MAVLDSLVVSIKADMAQFTRAMTSVEKHLKATSSLARKVGETMRDLGGALSLRVTAPLATLGGVAVKTAADFEQVSIAMETLIGNTQEAHRFIRDLQQFAASTPFEFTGLLESSKLLMAMGFEAKRVIPIMRAVGDATSALGLGQEGINRIIFALGQMRAAGRVTSQDMMQLTSAGINAWQMLADAAGTSVAEVKKLAEKGAIDAESALRVILEGMQRQFGGMMDRQSSTLLGVWSNFRDQLDIMLIDLGNNIASALDLKGVVQRTIAYLELLADWFSSLSKETQRFIIVGGGVAAALGPALYVLGQMSVGLGAVLKGFSSLVKLIKGPWGAAAVAIGSSIALIVNEFGLWDEAFAALVATFKTVKTILLTGFDVIADSFSSVARAFWLAVRGKFREAWKTLQESGLRTKEALIDASHELVRTWTADFEAARSKAESFGNDIKRIFGGIKDDIERTTGDAARAVDTNFGLIADDALSMERAIEAVGRKTVETSSKIETSTVKTRDVIRDNFEAMKKRITDVRQTVVDFSNSFGRAVADTIFEGGKLKDKLSRIFKDMARNIVGALVSIASQWIAVRSLMKLGLMPPAGVTAGTAVAGASGAAVAGAGVSGVLSGIKGLAMKALPYAGIALGAKLLYDNVPVVRNVVRGVGRAISGIGRGIRRIFGFADGGIVKQPVMGVVGEAGPEAIVPLRQADRYLGPRQQTIVVQLDGRTIAESTFENLPEIVEIYARA